MSDTLKTVLPGRNNLCINNDILATDIRLKKSGQYVQIQYSMDDGKTYHNIEDAGSGRWIHLFVNPIGDVDGDGTDDKVIDRLHTIDTEIEDIGKPATPEEIEDIFAQKQAALAAARQAALDKLNTSPSDIAALF